MSEIRIEFDLHASESLKQAVIDHLDMYNVGVTGFTEYSPVNLFLRDGGARSRAAPPRPAAAARDPFRAGPGRPNFQAPDFYVKQGYEIYARADDWPVGHAHVFLRKALPSPP